MYTLVFFGCCTVTAFHLVDLRRIYSAAALYVWIGASAKYLKSELKMLDEYHVVV